MKKILLLSPGLDQTLAMVRYLRLYGGDLTLHGGVLKGEALTEDSSFDRIFMIEDWEQLEDYDLVIPTGAQSTLWMAIRFEELVVHGMSYHRENVRCFDKIEMVDIVNGLGIPVPKTYLSIDDIGHAYPVFYKAKYERGGGNRGVAYSAKQLFALPDLQDLFFQEYIPGASTYGVGFLARHGALITDFSHEEFLSLPRQGGSAACIRKFQHERLSEYTKRIVQHLSFSGWGLLEFKHDRVRNDFVFMELNAKWWASLEFALMNNSRFMDSLFGLEYSEKDVQCAVFVDRLLQLGWVQTVKHLNHLLLCKRIRYQTTFNCLKMLLAGLLPRSLRRSVKNLMHTHAVSK